MTRGEQVAGLAGLSAGAAAVGVAGLLLHRVLRAALEIDRYVHDIATATDGARRATALDAEFAALLSAADRLRAAATGARTTEASR